MTNVATYQNISDNVPEDQRYFAYIILPDGNFWTVRFNGATEEIARTKAIALWEKENEKWKRLGLTDDKPEVDTPNDPWAAPEPSAKGAHIVGKVWMRNKDTRQLARVALTEIALYEKNGYVRGGPRSK